MQLSLRKIVSDVPYVEVLREDHRTQVVAHHSVEAELEEVHQAQAREQVQVLDWT